MLRILLCIITTTCFASQINNYFNYFKDHYEALGPYGNYNLGEIEIVDDTQKIAEIERVVGRKVGVVAEDPYWLWINDAVIFPSGKFGVYGRMIWRQSLKGIGGVALMPVLADGRICLNRNFRHATRTWEYELPRGCVQENETNEDAAIRETKEETGLVVGQLHLLGRINPDSGMTNSVVPVYLAKVLEQGIAQIEDSEAIAGVEYFSLDEIKKGLVDGYLSVEIDKNVHKINLRDPFLAFAILQCELRNLF